MRVYRKLGGPEWECGWKNGGNTGGTGSWGCLGGEIWWAQGAEDSFFGSPGGAGREYMGDIWMAQSPGWEIVLG